jgi:hypothetical protein
MVLPIKASFVLIVGADFSFKPQWKFRKYYYYNYISNPFNLKALIFARIIVHWTRRSIRVYGRVGRKHRPRWCAYLENFDVSKKALISVPWPRSCARAALSLKFTIYLKQTANMTLGCCTWTVQSIYYVITCVYTGYNVNSWIPSWFP